MKILNQASGAVGMMRKAKTFFRYLEATLRTIDFAIEQFTAVNEEPQQQPAAAPAPVVEVPNDSE